MQRGFPTHPESLTKLTNTLLGAPILYQPVLLAQLGPDITGGGFGSATWAAGNWIGTHTVGSFVAFGSPDIVGGYIAQQDEVIEQITLYAINGPSAQSTVAIWKKPTGGPFADTLQAITVPLGAERTYYTTPLSLTKGDVLAFYLDAGDPDWVVPTSGLVVWGLRRMA